MSAVVKLGIEELPKDFLPFVMLIENRRFPGSSSSTVAFGSIDGRGGSLFTN